jgi:hypothetical protein
LQLYTIKNKKLASIERNSFKLEIEIQALVEGNLETLFGLEFVSTEFTVSDFRLDTLAYDEQNRSFVIVEYKRGSSYSVVDQGYSYLSVMLNNKADFILEYNEKTGRTLKRTEIDWTSSKVIFISPSFNNYQRNSVNFRDVPFELWEIRRFEDNIVALEQCTSTSNESIEKLSKIDSQSVISKVSSEVRVLTEDDHLASIDEPTRQLWLSLRERIEDFPDSSFFAATQYVSWKREKTAVCFIYFRKKELRIDILRGNLKGGGEKSRGFFTLDDPKGMAKEKSWTWKSGTSGHSYSVSVKKPAELDYLLFLLEQKYKSLD